MLTRALPVLYYFLFECKEPTTSFDVTSTTFGFLFYEDCQQFRCSPMPPTFICFTSSSCGLVFANASNCLHGILVTHCLGVRQCLHRHVLQVLHVDLVTNKASPHDLYSEFLMWMLVFPNALNSRLCSTSSDSCYSRNWCRNFPRFTNR